MEINESGTAKRLRSVLPLLKKWRFLLLLGAAGVLLLLLPSGRDAAVPTSVETEIPEILPGTTPEELEARMEQILMQMDGAGAVRVMLTKRNDGVTTYQTDTQTTASGGGEDVRVQTVFYSNGSAKQSALIRSISGPEYLGAVVVCEGAQNAEVRLQLVKAVCALTGLSSDRVTVLKMKSS